MLGHRVKTAVIGGASITWMPTFINDLAACESMAGGEIALYDIDREHQDIIYRFARKLLAEKGKQISVSVAETLDDALTGSDFVVCTFLIGGHEPWAKEMDILFQHGLQHPKGMSVGAGGVVMGLRQVPAVVALAKRMEALCPQAWLLNFSNPMQTISLAVERYSSIKYVGLCHGVTHTISRMCKLIGVPEDEVTYTIGGVNHFEIITKLERNGEDLLPRVADAYEKMQREEGKSGEIVTAELYRLFGGYPCNEDIHVIEFLPYYIHKDSRLEDYEQVHNHVSVRIANRAKTWERVQNYIAGNLPLTEVIDANSSEKLADIVDGVCQNRPTYMYANVTNRGYITNLPDDMSVEVPVVIRRDGYQGVRVGALPKGLAALQRVHGAVQDLTVEAAMTGCRHTALQAMSLDPMCYTLTLAERRALLDRLIDNVIEFLPDFKR